MNRTIWIWRLIAVLILLLFMILMWNLYARLTKLQRQRPTPPPAEKPVQSSASTEPVTGGTARPDRASLRATGGMTIGHSRSTDEFDATSSLGSRGNAAPHSPFGLPEARDPFLTLTHHSELLSS